MAQMIKENRIKEVSDDEIGKYQAEGYSLIGKRKEKTSLVSPAKENKNGSSAQNKADAL